MINAAFIYVAPDQNPQEQKAVIPSETLTLHVVGCSLMNRQKQQQRNWLQTDVVPLSCVQGLVTKELHGSRRQLGRRFR